MAGTVPGYSTWVWTQGKHLHSMGPACLILHEDDRGLAGGCEDSRETCTEGVTWGQHIASLRRVA